MRTKQVRAARTRTNPYKEQPANRLARIRNPVTTLAQALHWPVQIDCMGVDSRVVS